MDVKSQICPLPLASIRSNSAAEPLGSTRGRRSRVLESQVGGLGWGLGPILGSGVVALGMPEDGKVALIAGVTKDLTGKVHAGKLMQALAPMVGGKGGGRPDLAEAGGKDTTGLKTALQSVPSLLEALL